MPIYEFYCTDCETVFSFYSRTVNTTSRPSCPDCRKKLTRAVSLFSIGDPTPKENSSASPPVDERNLEKMMSGLAAEAETISDDDPRRAAALLKKYSEKAGVPLGDGMQEALQRLASGEDPDRIESEMGDVLDSQDPFQTDNCSKTHGGKPGPKTAFRRDDTLYEM